MTIYERLRFYKAAAKKAGDAYNRDPRANRDKYREFVKYVAALVAIREHLKRQRAA